MKLTSEHRASVRDYADCMRYDHIDRERSMGVMTMALLDDFAELEKERDSRKRQVEQCELARLKLLMCLENCIDLADGKEKSKQDFKLRLDEIKKTYEEANHQRFR